MEKIIFDKDKIKISRISMYDGSIYNDIVKEYRTHVSENREPKTKLGKAIKAFRKSWSEE